MDRVRVMGGDALGEAVLRFLCKQVDLGERAPQQTRMDARGARPHRFLRQDEGDMAGVSAEKIATIFAGSNQEPIQNDLFREEGLRVSGL